MYAPAMTAFASVAANEIAAGQVHDTIARHMLADGFAFVLDIDASQGSQLVDARTGTSYLDLFTFFASAALGMNHPALADDATADRAEAALRLYGQEAVEPLLVAGRTGAPSLRGDRKSVV